MTEPDLQPWLGQLGIPGTLAAAAVLIYYGYELAEKINTRRHGNGNGATTSSFQASMTAAITSLLAAVAALEKQGEGDTEELATIRKELGEVRRSLDRAEVRSETLLSREDAAELAERNRKVMHDGFAEIRTILREAVQ